VTGSGESRQGKQIKFNRFVKSCQTTTTAECKLKKWSEV